MGANTLATATDGTVIPAADHNSIVTALKDNLIPRDTSTLAATDLAGDLGATSYRWDNAHIKKCYIGTSANLNTIEETGSDIDIKRAGTTKLLIEATGFSGTYLKDDTTPKRKMVALGHQISSSSGVFSTSSISFTDVTNLSISLTTTGRPVYIGLIQDGTANDGRVYGSTTTGVALGNAFVYIKILRDSTGILQNQAGGSNGNFASFSNSVTVPPSSYWTIDTPTAGTYTYKVQVRSQDAAAGSVAGVSYTKLIAYEL